MASQKWVSLSEEGKIVIFWIHFEPDLIPEVCFQKQIETTQKQILLFDNQNKTKHNMSGRDIIGTSHTVGFCPTHSGRGSNMIWWTLMQLMWKQKNHYREGKRELKCKNETKKRQRIERQIVNYSVEQE